MKATIALLVSAWLSVAMAASTARYRIETAGAVRPAVVKSFTMSRGPEWIHLDASKANGQRFDVWLKTAAYPSAQLDVARKQISRYILREGSAQAREYRNAATGEPVLPSMGGWEYMLPRPMDSGFPEQVRYLGHRYVRDSLSDESAVAPPEDIRIVELRPDLLVGPASNRRQKDETRRWDDSEYEYVRLARADYREMAAAGVTCVSVDEEQAGWAEELGLFYWGGGKGLPYPELLYRSQYLGPTMFLDEPAVCTRDYVIRPRLAKDQAFRKAITPQIAFDEFSKFYDRTLREGPPMRLIKGLADRADVDLGDMRFAQQNLYSWETMTATAAYQLSRDPHVPEAMVFEPPGRIGTQRTVPEMDMSYGVQIRPDDPRALIDVIIGFLRGAARLTNKGWGVSIYGSVQRNDAPFWLTHAYDLGSTRFFFWDNARSACVPYGEVLALARHLKQHAGEHPRRDFAQLRKAAEVVILLPPGYNLGHVKMGRGELWGVGELNLERVNAKGVKYRKVMQNFLTEIERCMRLGVSFDLLWDLPGTALQGYREMVRVREDGKVEVHAAGKSTVLDGARIPARPSGAAPKLAVTLKAQSAGKSVEVAALAKVTETTAPVYYTVGTDFGGVYQNAMVAWELYGPEAEDYLFLAPDKLSPTVRKTATGGEAETRFTIQKVGRYRLRASTVDQAGRSTVVWTNLMVSMNPASGSLKFTVAP
ncbi:MAG: hypothetical protein ABFD86_20820 [Bryobacteraceae bacterium]